jgi:hypothetical protein
MDYNLAETNRMALSFQPLASLANVQPISLGGLDVSQIKPLSPFQVGNPRSELVAQGIASGVKDISTGVLSSIKSDRDQKLQDLKDQRELARDVMKMQVSKQEKQISQLETMRHNKEMERLSQERIKNVTPEDWGGSPSSTTPASRSEEAPKPSPATLTGLPSLDRYERDAPMGKSPFESINLPETTEEDPTLMKTDRILGDLTAPMPIEAAPTPMGSNAMNALANVDWSSVRANLGAGIGAGATQVDIPATQSSFYSAKPPTSINTLGGISNTGISNIEKQLAAMPLQALAPIPTQQTAPKASVPRNGFNTYEEARAYIESQADNPNWYASGTPEPNKQGKFVIPWKQNDPELMSNRKDAAKAREETTKSQQGLREQNTLNREAVMFQSHPAVKAFTAPNGMQQSFIRFVKDYDAIAKNPEGAGISDVGLLDMFARAEGGGRVTEGQANLVLGSMGLVDKAKTLGMRLEGGDRLSQNQRDQMLRVIAEDNDAQAKIANQAVQMTRAKLIKQGVKDEDSLPQPYIVPQTKFQALEKIDELKKEALKLNAERQKAFASGDKYTSDKIKKQMDEIGKNAVELRKQIDKSKSSIINLEEIESTPQGWTGGAATTLIQQQ